MPAPAPDLMTQVVEHIQCSHAAMDTANAALTKVAATKAATQAAIPAVVEALVRHGRIDAADREKAAAALADPVRALSVLLNTADPAQTIHPRPIGVPAPGSEKTAAAGGYRYPGQRTGQPSPADLAFEQAILGR